MATKRAKGTFGCIEVDDEFISTLQGVEPVILDVIKEIGERNEDDFLSVCHRMDPVEYCRPEELNQVCRFCEFLGRDRDECGDCLEKTWR